MAICNSRTFLLLLLSLCVSLAAWWLASSHVPASYDRPPVINADGSVYFDHSNLLMPSSVEEIVKIVESANRDKRKIRVLGAGHSRSPIAHSSDLHLSLYNYTGVVSIDRRRREVVVRAGTLLKHLNTELRRNGLSLSSLPTLGDQTIGGALAVGSHGTGFEYGNMATFVTSLSFVSGSGKYVTVNSTTDPDLFKASLVGLGALGVVTEVTFSCEESFNLRENITITSLDDCLENLHRLSTLSDHGKLWIAPHSRVCAVFNVWRTKEPQTEEQGVSLWDLKNRMSEPLLWLGSWLPSINPYIIIFLYHYVQLFTPYERIGASEDVFIAPLYVPANNQLEFSVDAKDCVAALKEWDRIASGNPHTNIFTEVRYVKKDDIFLSPNFGRDSCQITIIIYNPSQAVLLDYFTSLCESLSKFAARAHWAKYLCDMGRPQLEEIYPKFSEFAKIRERMDPNRIFINKPLEKLFGIEKLDST